MKNTLRIRRILSTAWAWLKWPTALLVLWWLYHNHRESFRELMSRDPDWLLLSLGLVLCLASIASTYVRWWMLVWAQDIEFSLAEALRIGFLGYLFNYVGPGSVGGDFLKAVMLVREQSSRRIIAAATVLVDRLIGLVALLLTGSLMAFLPSGIKPRIPNILAVYHVTGWGGLAAMVLLMLPAFTRNRLVRAIPRLPVVGRIAGELINSLILYQARWRVVALTMIISVVGHIVMLASFYLCALGIHSEASIPSLADHLQFLPAAELAGVIVPTPAGIGALEGAMGHFYELAGSSFGDGVLTAIAYRAVTIVIACLGAVCYVSIRRDVKEAMQAAEANQQVEPAGE